ncbi:MAG: hypothetical protein JWP35_838 [Caulobacter sp.]|nr:hypothetical protein [Caulobacter sp.]
MDLNDPIASRVLRWRFEGLGARLAQAVLIGVLCWLQTHEAIVGPWLALTLSTAAVDGVLSRRLFARPDDRRLSRLTTAARTASAACYASVCFIFLMTPSPIGFAAAVFVGCAITLNNAMMTRGSRVFTATLVGPACLTLIAVPLVGCLLGRPLSLSDAALLTIGGVAYAVFIVRLGIALNREGETLRKAMDEGARHRELLAAAGVEATRERRRWSMVFDQSPLPQTCFDASALHDALSAQADASLTPDAALRAYYANMAGVLGKVVLKEANQAAHALFGVDDFGGAIAPSHFGKNYLAGITDAVAHITPDGIFRPFEAQIVRPNGEVTDVRVHIRTLPDGDRPWSHCLATYVDMTEAKAAARVQDEAVAAAEASNRAKSDFLAIMSHEIRTPLNGVLGMAQAMGQDRLSKIQAGRITVIRQSGEALLAILNDLLDLSKIEAGRLDLEEADFDLEQTAAGAHDAFAALAQAKGLAFDLSVDEAVRGRYRGDAFRIRQVLTNLISNAVKFTQAGAVRVSVTAGPKGLRLSISDTGMGIAADRVGSLFHKFVQADTSTTRRFGGTGLGLAISRELCEAMGGDIAVESCVGQGSLFLVDLPLVRLGETADAAQTVAAPHEADGDVRLPVRVLAAEDNAVNQLVLRTLLQQFGIDPVIVGNGAEAVAAWEAEPWDLVLMDIQMPVMDGPTACHAIRAREAATGRARTPIIALTANAMSHQVADYARAGMDGVVAKPIEIARLYEALAGAGQPMTDLGLRATG